MHNALVKCNILNISIRLRVFFSILLVTEREILKYAIMNVDLFFS